MQKRTNRVSVYLTDDELRTLRHQAKVRERSLDYTIRHRELVRFTPHELAIWEALAKKLGCGISDAVRYFMTEKVPGYAEPVPEAPIADVIPITAKK